MLQTWEGSTGKITVLQMHLLSMLKVSEVWKDPGKLCAG